MLTNSSGAYDKAVSEHMFAMLLSLQKKLHLYRDDQKQHIWGEEGYVASITDATILILGAGNIGKHFAGAGSYARRPCNRHKKNARKLSALYE